MKKIITIFIFLLMLCGCGKEVEKRKVHINTPDTINSNSTINYENILKEDDYIIVDVRTKEEYDSGHVKNAINIPYDEINENTNLDKNKVIMVYCKSGGRSAKAYNTLISLGYTAYDLGAYENITLEKE